MAHFAQLDENNNVLQVIVVHNNELLIDNEENEQKGIDFCIAHYGGRWLQTSFNNKFRKNFAGVNFLYDPFRDAFISPKPFDSWVLNEETCRWEAPTPMPTDQNRYLWNEDDKEWNVIL
jgi:hypothetical protein